MWCKALAGDKTANDNIDEKKCYLFIARERESLTNWKFDFSPETSDMMGNCCCRVVALKMSIGSDFVAFQGLSRSSKVTK